MVSNTTDTFDPATEEPILVTSHLKISPADIPVLVIEVVEADWVPADIEVEAITSAWVTL